MERRAIRVSGIVQGVGFRPFVFTLAAQHGLSGFVRNTNGVVWIEVEGKPASLECFLAELTGKAPPLARVLAVSWSPQPLQGARDFLIEESSTGEPGEIFVPPDVATCADCLRELFNPTDRRHGYPFINCTNCGPRLTIITSAPYDRTRTTMAGFVMCAACRARYKDPADRRFHAQPIACWVCGPQLCLLDADGLGTDGAIWGGEILVGDYHGFRRVAHLRYVGMPGGERAIREPWRMAVAHLADADVGFDLLEARGLRKDVSSVMAILNRRLNTPATSSVGRLFDAVASLAGVRDRVCYEGQAAVELEGLAAGEKLDGTYPFELEEEAGRVPGNPVRIIDTRPLVGAIARDAKAGVNAARIARRFHTTLVGMVAKVCRRVRAESGHDAVVLSGGVFLNTLLAGEVCTKLRADGFRVYRHPLVPTNDGGLSLGQVAVAAALTAGPPSARTWPCASASPAR
jgi:hydrogenase maturation factor HypF (carbamoyltransferase family)